MSGRAKASRSQTKRQPARQSKDVSDEEMDDDRPRSQQDVKATSRTQQGGTSKDADGSDQSDNDESEDEVIDIANFQDVPLDKESAAKFQGINKDWLTFREKHMESYEMMRATGNAVADWISGDERVENLDKLDTIFKELMDIDFEMGVHENSAITILQEILQDVPVTEPADAYQKSIKTAMNDYRKKTSRQKYMKSEEYANYKEQIWEVLHEGEGVPPMSHFIPKEEGDVSDDEELEVGGATQTYKCPLTSMTLADAVTSVVCNHSFSRLAIEDYFRTTADREGKIKCPMSGCNSKFLLGQLKNDASLQKRVNEMVKRRDRKAKQQRDADAEEIDSD